MATTKKTATKASSTSSRSKSVSASRASKSTTSAKSSTAMNVSDLRSKVLDPKNRRSLYIAVALILLALIAFFGKSLVVAALVNGEPVSRIAIIRDLEKQSGKAALDAVITRKLIFQEASKKNVNVTDKDIDGEIKKISDQFKSQGQNLDQLLAAQGLSKDKFRDEVKVQVAVTKILGNQVKVTDKEFNDFLAKNKDILANEKDQNQAKAALRQQMEQQKLAQKYQEWIANIKKSAKVSYFVNY